MRRERDREEEANIREKVREVMRQVGAWCGGGGLGGFVSTTGDTWYSYEPSENVACSHQSSRRGTRHKATEEVQRWFNDKTCCVSREHLLKARTN